MLLILFFVETKPLNLKNSLNRDSLMSLGLTFSFDTLTVGIVGFVLKNLLILDSFLPKFVVVAIPPAIKVVPTAIVPIATGNNEAPPVIGAAATQAVVIPAVVVNVPVVIVTPAITFFCIYFTRHNTFLPFLFQYLI